MRYRYQEDVGPGDNIEPGEWVRPKMKGYYLRCCDCRLVHRINFKVIEWENGKREVMFQAFRLPRRPKK